MARRSSLELTKAKARSAKQNEEYEPRGSATIAPQPEEATPGFYQIPHERSEPIFGQGGGNAVKHLALARGHKYKHDAQASGLRCV